MERKKPIIGPIYTALTIFFILLLYPVSFLKGLISDQDVSMVAASNNLDKFKNVFLQKQAFSNNGKYLPFFGSSTIGIFSRYHPANYFTSNEMVPYMVGQPGCTSILHVMNFSGLSGALAHKKLLLMLDTTEFMNPNGIGNQGFTKFYSPYNGYQFIFNGQITPDDKKKVAEQLLKYSAVNKDPLLVTQLEGLTYGDFAHKIEAAALKPIAYLRMKILEKQDFIKSLQLVKTIKPYRQDTVNRNANWDELRQMAINEAKTQTNNNPYGMLNDFYNKTIKKEDLQKQKNSWKPNNNFLNSVAYTDLHAILDILKSEHADPVFVLIPQKGAWDDYRGFTKTYREQLYDKMVNEVKAAGFQVFDYRNHEYDPYFLRDTAHLGYTGWVQIDQDLIQYYKN